MTSSKKKLLSPEVLEKAKKAVLAAAKKEGKEVALVGGYALQFYGSLRLTGDIDVITFEPIDALPVIKSLSFGGYKSEIKGVPVDVIIRDDEFAPMYEEALYHSSKGIVPAEFIAAMKLASGRHKDLSDLEFLITEEVIDVKATRKIIVRTLGVYAAKEFDLFVDETNWKKSREE